MDVKKQVFKLFQDNKDQYDLYEKIIEYIESIVDETKGRENAEFYEVLRQLISSINNAGWQDRHSQQIDTINEEMDRICGVYEKYLP